MTKYNPKKGELLALLDFIKQENGLGEVVDIINQWSGELPMKYGIWRFEQAMKLEDIKEVEIIW